MTLNKIIYHIRAPILYPHQPIQLLVLMNEPNFSILSKSYSSVKVSPKKVNFYLLVY